MKNSCCLLYTSHNLLDNIEEIHGLYSPIALGIAAALACGGFTFLLGGGPIEMFCAFVGAGLGNFLRCKLTKHHYTLFLGIVLSVSLACLSYAGLLKLGEIFLGLDVYKRQPAPCAQNTEPVGLSTSLSLSYPISSITSSALWQGS